MIPLFIAPLFIALWHSLLFQAMPFPNFGSAPAVASIVSTPTDSPGQGTYGVAPTVTLSDVTSGATICYTTDASTPGAATPGTCDSSPTQTYSSGILLGVTTTVKAIGTKSGSINSSVLTSVYTVNSALGPVDSFLNCNTSSPGTTLTGTILTNCSQGGAALSAWTASPAFTGFTIAAHKTGCTLGGSVLVNGTLFATSTTSQSIAFDNSQTVPRYITASTTSRGYGGLTVSGCIVPGPATTIAASNKLFDLVTIIAPTTGTFVVMQLNTGQCGGASSGIYGVGLHYQDSGGASVLTGCAAMVPGTPYWYSLHADFSAGTPSLSVYDGVTHAQISTTINAVSTPTKTATDLSAGTTIRLGNNEVGTDTATTSFENTLVSFAGQATAPVGPQTTSYTSPYLVSQSVGNGSAGATTTASAASQLITGNLNLVFWSSENASATVSGVADTAGNTYVSDATCKVTLATQGRGEMWWAVNATGNASNVVTATATSSTFRNIQVMQVALANASTPFDVCATGTTAAGNADLTTASFTPTTSTGTAFMGGYITAGVALLPAANYYGILTSTTTSAAMVERQAVANSSQTAGMLQANTSTKWGVVFVAKK